MNTDIEFLKEMRDHITSGLNTKDPEDIKYGLKMINDWIDELEGEENEQGVEVEVEGRCEYCNAGSLSPHQGGCPNQDC